MNLRKLIGNDNDPQYLNSDLTEAYYLVYYMSHGDDKTDWSTRVMKFKYKSDVDDYNIITETVCQALIKENLTFDIVVRVLGHSEVNAVNNVPIDDFAKEVSKVTKSQYIPNLMIKRRATEAFHNLNLNGRQNAAHNNYYVDDEIVKRLSLNPRSVLIVDDITTSGTSLKEIARALKEKWPNVEVYSLCLARTLHYNSEANLNL